MVAQAGAAGLARVRTGWQGQIQLTISGVDATCSPEDYDSPYTVLRRLLQIARRVHDTEDLVGWPGGDGKFRVLHRGGTNFDLSATSNTDSRMGLTSTLTGAPEYVFPSDHEGGHYPTRSLGMDSPGLEVASGGMVGTGAKGWPKRVVSEEGRIRLYPNDVSEAIALETALDDGEHYDVWQPRGDRVLLDRVRLMRLSRAPMATSRTDLVIESRTRRVR